MIAFQPTEKGAEIDFSGSAPGDVARHLGAFFSQAGFKLEKGDPTNDVYGSGSAIGRLAAGGLVSRQRYEVRLTSADGVTVHASVASAMSGISGGALGVMRERKQRRGFVESLQAYLA